MEPKNKILKLLLDLCEEADAEIVSFKLYNEVPIAVVESSNGTPVTFLYDEETKTWQ